VVFGLRFQFRTSRYKAEALAYYLSIPFVLTAGIMEYKQLMMAFEQEYCYCVQLITLAVIFL